MAVSGMGNRGSILHRVRPLRPLTRRVQSVPRNYFAHAYASTRGSAAALRTPVWRSTAMAALEPKDQGAADCSLWPLAWRALWVASGMRDSTDKCPGSVMLCGKTEEAKPRVDHRGASIAC